MGNNISEITRNEIARLFCDGFTISFPFEDKKVLYPYHGHLSEIDFLKKIYPLDELPSTDARYLTAEEDIWKHTVCNDDWGADWIFSDPRFGLQEGDDNIFLEFLCAVFHPAYRKEDGYWKECLERIQSLLKPDGYELYVSDVISGRSLYRWRTLTDAEKASPIFLPFSQRYKGYKLQLPRISQKKRKELADLMHRMEDNLYLTGETGLNYYKLTTDAIIDDIKNKFYTPMAYDKDGQYSDEDNFDKLMVSTSPRTVFDIIELFAQFSSNDFANGANSILTDLNYKLVDGKIIHVSQKIQAKVPAEENLRDLIIIAESLNAKDDVDNKQLALEKLWDAFEKLKTYYSPDKKKFNRKNHWNNHFKGLDFCRQIKC